MYVTNIAPVTKCFKYTCSPDSYTHTCMYMYVNIFMYVCNWVREEKISHLDKWSHSYIYTLLVLQKANTIYYRGATVVDLKEVYFLYRVTE